MRTNDGGPAFPRPLSVNPNNGEMCWDQYGLTVRDWFATFAPQPTEVEVNAEWERDKLTNPHNDPHKSPRRSLDEIKAALRYRYADSMIKEHAK